LIKRHSNKPAKVNEVITFVKRSGGISYTQDSMLFYMEEANVILETFPDSDFKNSLRGLVQYTIERTK
jgi:octaprenyl-diphosphate synthase